MGKKGQIEIIALFGVIFVAVAVLFYAYQSGSLGVSPVPAGVAEQQKSVKGSLDNFVRLGAQEILANISMYGGYSSEDAFYSDVMFNGRPVPYWQKNGALSLPTAMQTEIMAGLTKYIKENINGLISDLDMDNVTVDASAVSVSGNILPVSIVLYIYLPVYVQNYLIQQPLTVTVPTKFGEIVEFSQGLMNYEVQNRPFEWFTLSSMLISEPTDGVPSVPFFVAVFECGKVVMKNWFDVQPAADYALKVTLAHTYMPGKAPQGTYDTQPYPKYSLPTLNGKTYSDLDVSFHLPDDFELSRFRFNFNPNPVMVIPTPIPMTSVCSSNPVYVKYYVKYPMVIRVKDPITGNVFQFANEVYIKDNSPGAWSGGGTGYSNDQAELCASMYCSGKITVKDTAGKAIPDAQVSFMGCDIGKTFTDGVLEVPIPCGAGLLEIYKRDYKEYIKSTSYSDLVNYQATLRSKPDMTINIYKVNVLNLPGTNKFMIDTKAGRMNVEPIATGQHVQATLIPKSGEMCEGDLSYCYRQFDTATGDLRNIASDSYVLLAYLTDSAGKTWGISMNNDFIVTETMAGKQVNLYIPYNYEFSQADQTDWATYAQAFENLMQQCGISVTSETAAPETPCGKNVEVVV